MGPLSATGVFPLLCRRGRRLPSLGRGACRVHRLSVGSEDLTIMYDAPAKEFDTFSKQVDNPLRTVNFE